VSESVSRIFPEGVSAETYNSQYLQKNSSFSTAILAAAQAAARVFNDPQEAENISFSALAESIQLDVATALRFLALLSSISCPRLDEFRAACDEKFPLSTVFKSALEQTQYRQQVLAAGIHDLPEADGTVGPVAEPATELNSADV